MNRPTIKMQVALATYIATSFKLKISTVKKLILKFFKFKPCFWIIAYVSHCREVTSVEGYNIVGKVYSEKHAKDIEKNYEKYSENKYIQNVFYLPQTTYKQKYLKFTHSTDGKLISSELVTSKSGMKELDENTYEKFCNDGADDLLEIFNEKNFFTNKNKDKLFIFRSLEISYNHITDNLSKLIKKKYGN